MMNTHCFPLPIEWYADSECKAPVQETDEQAFLKFLNLHCVSKPVPEYLKYCHLHLLVAVCPLPAEVTGHADV